jgi:nucleoside-diphosphate-sugar epimerase
MNNDVFNVGLSEANFSKLELANKIKEYIPDLVIKEDDFKNDFDKRNYIVSNEKLESYGWKPKYTVNDGIKELITAYKMIIKYNNKNFTNL